MNDDSTPLAARVTALEDMVIGLMSALTKADPALRKMISEELTAAADDAGERNSPLVREAIEIMAESFKHHP